MKIPKTYKDVDNYDIADPLCPRCHGVGWMKSENESVPWDPDPETSTGPGTPCKCNPLSGFGTILN